MTRTPPRWLQLLPVLVMFTAAVIVAAIPHRTARQDRLIGAVIYAAAGLLVAAFLLIFAWRYLQLVGGLSA